MISLGRNKDLQNSRNAHLDASILDKHLFMRVKYNHEREQGMSDVAYDYVKLAQFFY